VNAPDELAELTIRWADRVLSNYVDDTQEALPPGFTDWVMRSVAYEKIPKRGLLTGMARLVHTPTLRPLQVAVMVFAVLAAAGAALALGEAAGVLPGPGSSGPTHAATTASPSPTEEPSDSVPPRTPGASDDEGGPDEAGPDESGSQPDN
jgi:hypothetical protein